MVRDWMAEYGYRNIRMPIVEQTDLFVRSIGAVTDIVEKEMYSFLDSLNGDSLTLRPEGTASCVRAVLEHNLLYAGPQRLVLFRPDVSPRAAAKRPVPAVPSGRGGGLGYAGPDIDAELIVMCAELWKKLGIFDVRPGNRHAWQCGVASGASDTIDRISGADISGQLDDDAASRRLHSNPLRILDSKNR